MELVLAQQNSFVQPQNNTYNCGTPNKCSMCMYKLICDRSPFCCIKNNGGSCDLTPIINELSQLETSMSNEFSNINTNINSIGATINTLNNSINSIGEAINTMSTKIDEILSKLNTTNTISGNAVPTVDAEILSENEQGLVPVSNNNETVLVQKKSVFGKTKWVEEKK